MKRTCKQCGKEFFITKKEIDFYKGKNLSIPKRCKECRDANKKNKSKEAVTADTKTTVDEVTITDTKPVVNVEETSAKKDSKKTAVKALPLAAALLLIINSSVAHINQSDEAAVDNTNTVAVEESYTQEASVNGFRNSELLEEHYQKHGTEMGFESAASYEEAAKKVVGNPDALHKTEAEDGDDVYYLEETNEFVIVSIDGYIRTFFMPEDGIAYFNRQ